LRFKGEFKLFDRLYIYSQHQIRSYSYLPSVRKVRQISKRILSLDVSGVCADVSVTKLSPASMLTRQSFDSLQWRFLAVMELLSDLAAVCRFLVERLTQEMSVPVFLHFPVAFLALSASIAALSEEFTNSLFGTFCELRTFHKLCLVEFPEDGRPNFPELPWDPAFEVQLPGVAVPRPPAAKIEITEKMTTHFRNKPAEGAQKPKSFLDSPGF
jgi:hypothetical protein